VSSDPHDLCIRRPVFATMRVWRYRARFLLLRRLGVDLFPTSTSHRHHHHDPQRCQRRGGGSGITKPIEEIVNTIDGIDELRSTSEGISTVIVQFLRRTPRCAQEVRDKVATVIARLPTGTDSPIVEKFDVDAQPIMSVVVAGKRNLREVTEVAKKQIKEVIETVPGVGAVIMIGGRERAVNVTVNPDKMSAYQVPALQVRDALQKQNIELPGGRVDQGNRELVLRTMGRMEDVDAFADLIVTSFEGRPIRIRDIGRVENGTAEPTLTDGRASATRTRTFVTGALPISVPG
jgi:HAE1 family hydrophobic/amphiphilic exporter-1